MFRRISKYVGRYLGVSSTESDRINPEASLAIQQERFREQLAHYNRSLAASARLCDLLKDQIKGLEEEERASSAALDAQTQAGSLEKTAGELLLRLDVLRSERGELHGQLEQAEATCEEITLARDAAIQAAQKKLETLRGSLSEQQLRQALTEVSEHARSRD